MNEQNTPPRQYLGLPDEDPTRPWYASGNYVGPNWSDGKNQESVEFGTAPVKNELDELAYYHDAAYARYKDEAHRRAADEIFYEEAMKLKSKYGLRLKEDPRIAGKLVLYGNYAKQKAVDTASNFAKYGVAGLIYQGGKNILEMNSRLTGSHLRAEKKDLMELYKTKSPTRAYVTPQAAAKEFKRIIVQSGEAVRNAVSTSSKVAKRVVEKTRNPVKVVPSAPELPRTQSQKDQLKQSQAQRIIDRLALRDAALASTGPRKVYHKQLLNLNAAKPKKKKKKKSISVRPA